MTADSPEKKAELISPRDLADRLTHDKNLILLDVREDFERDICTINGARPIPLADLKTKAAELDPTKCYVVYCKAGLRGNKGALILKSLGFDHVYNLEGGILRWIDELDSTLNRY